MGFFEGRRAAGDDPDDDGEIDEVDELDEPRAAYVGGVVPIEAIIARTATAAVGLRGIVAYPDGFELRLTAWVRRPARGRRRGPFGWGSILLDPSELGAGDALPAELATSSMPTTSAKPHDEHSRSGPTWQARPTSRTRSSSST